MMFIGIGAQKAGTSWLYHWLQQHPSVRFPAGKELHFWDRFPDSDGAGWTELFADAVVGCVSGEITPAYATLQPHTVARIHALRPDARLIYQLRNPVHRSWSQMRMVFSRRGQRLDEAACLAFAHDPRCVLRSDYVGTIQRWRSVWGEEALAVHLFEDLLSAPRALLTSVARHVGIDSRPFAAIEEAALRRPLHAGPVARMPERVREHLEALYRPMLGELEELIGRDLSHWIA